MSGGKIVIITIPDDDSELDGSTTIASKTEIPSPVSSDSSRCQSNGNNTKKNGLNPDPAAANAARGHSTCSRMKSVDGAPSDQATLNTELRSPSEAYHAASLQKSNSAHPDGLELFPQYDSLYSMPGNGYAPPTIPIAYMGPQPMATDDIAPMATVAYTKVQATPTDRPNTTPHFQSPARGMTSAMDQSHTTPHVQSAMATKAVDPGDQHKTKRKAKEAITQAAKRSRTLASNRPSSGNSDTVVDSILWSTPLYVPSKDSKVEEPSVPKSKQSRKPRSKAWTSKMLAELGTLIQKSVPWGEFAEKNGKTLADVLEAYSIVVSMPLLDFAERGEKRIAQKKFKGMRQKYKEMEKDAVRIANEQAKKAAEDHFRVKKKGQRKENKRSSSKPGGAGDTILQTVAKSNKIGKTQAVKPAQASMSVSTDKTSLNAT